MAKPDPALLDPARYPHRIAITPRYADLDTNQHINNIAMSAMFEDARLRFLMDSGHGLPAGTAGMVVSLAVEYLNQTHYPDPIEFHAAITRVGRSSIETLQLAMQDGRPVAIGTTVFVVTDGAKAVPIPAHWQTALSALELRP